MNRRSVRGVFILILFTVVSTSILAQQRVGRRIRSAFREAVGQSAVVPVGCPGTGEELKQPTVLTADDKHSLSTTFNVVQDKRSVPVLTQANSTAPWTCAMTDFNLRMYVDPSDNTAKYPGPTLRLRRASDNYTPGDRFSILLKNSLPPSNEDCVWKEGNCNCTGASDDPQCCNDTTKPNGMNCMHGDNTTNLHFHGTHVSPQKPQDWVLLQLAPASGTVPGTVPHGNSDNRVSGEFQYAVDPLPNNQSEGTHWYHPHKHGSTAEQVGNGMAGAILIEGPFDDWLDGVYDNKLREKVLVVQNVHELNFTARKAVTPIPLINGQLAPQITMYRGEIQRWRFVNANIDADAQLVIDFDGVHDTNVEARQLMMDGVQFGPKNYQCQPLLDPTPCDGQMTDLKFMFSPGNRADFLIKAPDVVGELFVPYEVFGAIDDQGTKPDPDPRGGARSARTKAVRRTRAALDAIAPGNTQPALLSINVIDCPTAGGCKMDFPATVPDLPHFLRPIVPDRPQQTVQFQVVDTDGDPQKNPAPAGIFGIMVKGQNNDKLMQFDDSCANFSIPLNPDGGEEWHISQNGNRKGKPFHVFHIHINPFQVVSTFDLNGKKVVYPDPIWMDSITLPNNTNPTDPNNPSTEVVVRQRFEDFTGMYVMHCHFLGHEDRGMMLSVQTVCPNKTDSWSVTSTTQKECTFNQFIPAAPPCRAKTVVDAGGAHTH